MVKIFVAPSKNKNPVLFVLAIWFPIIAICPLPNAGRKIVKGDAMTEPSNGFLKFILIFFRVSCFGIFVFERMLKIRFDAPKSPVKRGRSGWFIVFKFRTISPRVPDNKNATRDKIFFFSEKINVKEIKIKI